MLFQPIHDTERDLYNQDFQGSDVKLQAPEILPNVFQHVSPFQIHGYVGYLCYFFGGAPPVSMGFLWWFTVGIQQADRLRGRDFSERLGWLCLGPSYLVAMR